MTTMSSPRTKTDILGADDSGRMRLWRDTRVEAREKVNAELEMIRRKTIKEAAHKSRKAAVELGNPRYTGKICTRNSAHGGERYVSGGGCVECARLGAERKRRERGAPVVGLRPRARHTMRSSKRQAARSRRADEWAGDRAA
jgi:hypothetical protein